MALASLVAVALALRAVHNDYAFYLAYLIFQYAALALGWNILGGYAGFVNFGAARVLRRWRLCDGRAEQDARRAAAALRGGRRRSRRGARPR